MAAGVNISTESQYGSRDANADHNFFLYPFYFPAIKIVFKYICYADTDSIQKLFRPGNSKIP